MMYFCFQHISLSKDKLLEIDSLYRNSDVSFSNTQKSMFGSIEENELFTNVHHIYDQVY